MNFLLIGKLQAVILTALAVSMSGSAALAWAYDESPRHAEAFHGFLFSALVTGVCAVGLFLFSRGSSNLIYRREALAVIGIGWITASLFGALPYYLILDDISLGGAIFESTSGLTTTGASILSELERLPPSLLFWRSMSQWIGGLGVVVFFVTVLAFLGAGAKTLFAGESSAEAADLDAPRVQRGILRLLLLYGLLSVCAFSAFATAGMHWFDAVNHAFTTISTGGFSTRSGSIADFGNPAVEWVTIVFMVIGGTSFIPMLRVARGDLRALHRSTEVKVYYRLLASATIVVALVLWFSGGGEFSGRAHETIRAAAFQVASIATTSGFATKDYDQWVPSVQCILVILMLIGGCSGSTSGGLKVIRVVIAAKISLQQVERSYRAHVVRPLRVSGDNLTRDAQETTLVFFVVLGAIATSSAVIIALLEPSLSLTSSVSAMIACLFNIGPGLDQIGPMQNYAGIHDVTKIFLALLMILGRVELFAVLVLFAPALWKKY